jgi:iron complex outermembrane recepter protein
MSKRSFNVFFALIAGLFFVLGDAFLLYAQETKSDEFTLEEITVTAQKRAENQQKVAIAMEVISSADIKELGKTNLDEILTNVSSAIVQKAADGYRISLRGISDDSSASFGQSMATPTVAINTDGVYSNRKDTGSSLYDVERVEVLYGPQSTMYSSASPGGIVNVVTASPKLDRYEVTGSIEGGSYSLLNLQGALNVPVAETVALRASVQSSKRDGYLTGGGDNENSKSARLRALYQPSDKLSFTLTGEYSKNKGAGFGGGVNAFDTQDGHYADGTKVTNPWTARSDESLSANDQTSKKVFMNINLDMGSIGALTLVPSYATRNGDNVMNFMGSVQYGTQRVKEKSAELRMTSAADFIFKWILGFNYYNSTDTNNMLSAEYVINNGAIGDYSFRTNTEKAKAVFANITYPVLDTFRLTAGMRKSWDKMITDNVEKKGPQSFNEHPVQDSGGRPDYKFGFEYDLNTSSMLYGDYATSYRVQGMAARSKPQELKAFTMGAKNRFFGNKLQLNAAAYYYKYSNYAAGWMEQIWKDDNGDHQMPPPGPPPAPGVESELKNDSGARGVVGAGHMMGLDISASALITSHDQVNLSLSYIKSEWTDLVFHWQYPTQDLLINGVFYKDAPHPDMDYSGKPMTNTPPWTINLSYNHNFDLWNGGVLKVGASVKYQTAYQLSWQDSWRPWNYQESHHMENANMAYNDPSGKWNLSVYVNNIENYAEKRTYMNAGGQGMLDIGDPRTYGVVLSVKF